MHRSPVKRPGYMWSNPMFLCLSMVDVGVFPDVSAVIYDSYASKRIAPCGYFRLHMLAYPDPPEGSFLETPSRRESQDQSKVTSDSKKTDPGNIPVAPLIPELTKTFTALSGQAPPDTILDKTPVTEQSEPATAVKTVGSSDKKPEASEASEQK